MRLDRYIGDEPKFKVLRRQPDGSYKEVPPFDYFVLALKDKIALAALDTYAQMAANLGDAELAIDVNRLAKETSSREDRKMPD